MRSPLHRNGSARPLRQVSSLLVGAVGAAASAQLSPVAVSEQIRVSPEGESWRDCSITVRSNKDEALVFAVGTGRDEIEHAAFSACATIRYTTGGISIVPARVSGRGGASGGDASNPLMLPAQGSAVARPGLAQARPSAASVLLGPGALGNTRVVMAVRDDIADRGGHNAGLPYVIYSDDGVEWKPDPLNGTVTPILVGSVAIEATTTGGSPADPGDTPWWVDRRMHLPSIAVDRIENDHDEVYVAFCARSAPGSTNTDLYVARSMNAEASNIQFPYTVPTHFLQVTDTLLGLPGENDGPDQFVPAIAIDGCGGVNLMFYDNRNDPDRTDGTDLVDVYYARISGFGTASPTVGQFRLTPNSFRVDNLTAFLGDYHNMAVSSDGKTIYAAYIARDNGDTENGERTCYVHRINLNCEGPLSDFNGDGQVTDADSAAYAGAWSADDPAADNDLDGAVDSVDLQNFLLTYSAEGGE